MAKALFGHIGGVGNADLRMGSEVRRLAERVRDLETMVARLQHENDALAALVSDETMLVVSDLAAERKQPEFV